MPETEGSHSVPLSFYCFLYEVFSFFCRLVWVFQALVTRRNAGTERAEPESGESVALVYVFLKVVWFKIRQVVCQTSAHYSVFILQSFAAEKVSVPSLFHGT